MIRRLPAAIVVAGGLVFLSPGIALAHGIGGRLDLPVPLSYFVVAAASALVLSFVALALLWPEPRLNRPISERRLVVIPRWLGVSLGAAGVVGLLLVVGQVVPSLLGIEQVRGRPTIAPVLVWVVLWLVIPFLAAFIGNWYRAINPWGSIGSALRIGETEKNDLLDRFGIWPASVALVAFAWLELISPDSGNPAALGWAAIIYSGYLFGSMALLGRETGLVVADLFTGYNRIISAISPLGRDGDGYLVWRGWLRALPVLPPWPGLTFFVLAAIGTVTYDGASGTVWFRTATQSLIQSPPGQTVLLLGCIGVVSAAYWSASWLAARLSQGTDASRVARRFAHTLIPIALAYAVAHYFTLIIFEGQQLFSAISDPFALGWDLFGTADRSVDFFITATEPIWYFQLAVIVVGHVLGVVLAHDRALVDFGPDAVRSQYAMLVLMVALTSLGLVILAG
ncbi:MAG TPA: hypothetical protein VIW94_11415 [Acidimicrobiia bacterium]